MKKFLTLVLALAMVMSLSVTAFAESGTTTLTVNVPNAAEPSFTLHIPADTTLTYGNTDKQAISGKLYAEDVQNIEKIRCKAPYTDLVNTSDPSDSIALKLFMTQDGLDEIVVIDQETGNLGSDVYDWYIYWDFGPDSYFYMNVFAQVDDWSGATPGATYQAVITFTAWVED